jgi:hypothetical protein
MPYPENLHLVARFISPVIDDVRPMGERADIGKDIRTSRPHLRKANEMGARLSNTFNEMSRRLRVVGCNVQ